MQVVSLTAHDYPKKQIEVSVGESVRIIRELQELRAYTKIISTKNNRVQLGVERAKVLAQALQCHPAVLVFPGWEIKQNTAINTCLRRRVRSALMR